MAPAYKKRPIVIVLASFCSMRSPEKGTLPPQVLHPLDMKHAALPAFFRPVGDEHDDLAPPLQ
jgi:hypothetical protein